MLNLKLVCRTVALSLAVASSGCVHSIEDDVSVSESPREDAEYYTQLEEVTKTRSVFKNFEKRYEISATYVSPEFRKALNARSQKVLLRDLGQFNDPSGRAMFIVSIYSPEQDRDLLDNDAYWTVLLSSGMDRDQKPSRIDRIDDKEHLRAFFDRVNDWTKEYILTFDVPAVNPNSPELVEKTTMNLIFANADAKVSLTW